MSASTIAAIVFSCLALASAVGMIVRHRLPHQGEGAAA
jgi:hypothetical protein